MNQGLKVTLSLKTQYTTVSLFIYLFIFKGYFSSELGPITVLYGVYLINDIKWDDDWTWAWRVTVLLRSLAGGTQK